MTAASAVPSPSLSAGPSVLRWSGVAFVYWLLFMGVLEPGNLSGAIEAGVRIPWGREAIRLVGAGVLGAATTPLLLIWIHAAPIKGPARLRNALLQGLGVVCLAPCLIVVSCFLTTWLFAGQPAPSFAEVRAQLLANTVLLIFCLGLFLCLIQIVRRLASANVAAPAEGGWVRSLTIKDRGRLVVVDVDGVDWIETQGNYQALHIGEAVHLLRETSSRLAARLDPSRFVRIHRRVIVAADRVRQIEPLANGDAMVRLSTGAQLRLSRNHREALRRRIDGGTRPPA